MASGTKRTTRDLRRQNRAALLSQLFLNGPASRLELVQASGLSSATVSNVVSDLIGDGLVGEAGSVGSDGGRPRTLLRVRPDVGYVVGIDVGETHLRAGLFDFTLAAVATVTYPIADTRLDPERVVALASAGVKEVTAGVTGELLGIGVGVPGAVKPDGLVHAPTLGWSGVAFAGMLAAVTQAPVHVDNCARTLGQAEMWLGAGRGAERAIIALMGVGIGAAVAADSGRGVTSTTSEWGHTIIQAGGAPCRCGSRGCLEAYVGAEAIIDDYRRRAGAQPFTADGTEGVLAELVARAATPGPAADALDNAAEYLGIGIANLVNLLAPDRIVLSGWAGETLGVAILPGVRAAVDRFALSYMVGKTEVELGTLGPPGVALGAATLPVVEVLSAGGR
ncbi:ROK family transcriptional regulator [Pseudonocardia sp. TRM90224]|uniref:ROK family transcriptional regulator n=1 Tax=Pseudonocardia sp. TRM90224 TaxID=2812678 RepID=UPI001E380CE1|nr:ROK family transcriptional regulator [Pseudonocardia sp. TRM90224]